MLPVNVSWLHFSWITLYAISRILQPTVELADGRGRQDDPALYPENLSSTEVLQALPQQLDTTPVFTHM